MNEMAARHDLSDLKRRINELENLALTRGLFREEKDKFEKVTDTYLPKHENTENQITIDFKARVLVIDDDDQIRELLNTTAKLWHSFSWQPRGFFFGAPYRQLDFGKNGIQRFPSPPAR